MTQDQASLQPWSLVTQIPMAAYSSCEEKKKMFHVPSPPLGSPPSGYLSLDEVLLQLIVPTL